MMFKVYMTDEATFDEVCVATFETLAEAEAYITECEAEDVKMYGKVIDELWIEEVK